MTAPLLLNPQDRAMFDKLGITVETLAAARVTRVSAAEARNEYGIHSFSGGVLFPYTHPITGDLVGARLRQDVNGSSKFKYLCPKGKFRSIYFPPGCKALLDKTPPVPLVAVEAEKSSLAL